MSRAAITKGQYWQPGGLRRVLVQWDGFWYLDIARHGYSFSAQHQSPMGFFPLYPLLTKAVSYAVPFEPRLDFAAIILSNVCLVAACFLLYELIRVDYENPAVARLAIVFLLFSPVSFFFSGAYAESLFLMVTTGSLLAAVRGRWLVASLLGMAAAGTRHIGVLILLPLLIEWVRQHREGPVRLRALARPQGVSLALVPMGAVLFFTYSYLRFNDFLAYFKASKQWGRRFTSPVTTFQSAAHYSLFHRWLFFGLLVAAVVLLVAGVRLKVRTSYLAFGAALVAVYLSSGTMEAMPRLLSIVFPLFVILALIAVRYRLAYEPLLATSVGVLGLCTVVYANGYWIT